MKLRTLVISGSVGLGTLGLAAAANLVFLGRRLHEEASRAAEARRDVYNAGELERSLRTYNRSVLLDSGAPETAARIAAEEAEILRYAPQITSRAGDPTEQALAGNVQRELGAFLEKAHQPAPGLGPLARFQMLSVDLAPVEDALGQLIRYDHDRSEQVDVQMERENTLASRLGIAIAFALALGIAVFLWGVGAVVYRPLMRLKAVIDRLAGGDTTARLPVDGVAELAITARAFNDLAETQERQREAQLRFLASVAHDLRNPLAAIAASADLLREESLANGERVEVTDVLTRQVKYLDRMVGDLLDTTRIEAGRLDLRLEVRDLTDLCRESVALCRLASARHRLRLIAPERPAPVRVDGVRIGQILNNLLGNAMKYSPEGGEIVVTVRVSERAAFVDVRDQGVGIPADELSAIFEPFRRSTSTRDAIPGIGLGLSVARRLARRHLGDLTVTSAVGEGSTFTLELPLAAGAIRVGADRLVEPRPVPGRRPELG